MKWSKLDYSVLDQGKKQFQKDLKKLKSSETVIFEKIKKLINDFIEMIPVIEKLKSNQNFKITHWQKLMREVGIEESSLNLKFITLQQVFDMHLGQHEEKVDEIVTMAA